MPTEEEFRLYARMAGGTGDIEQDAHIARHLQRIVNVPEREIASFVRTRDRNTVHKLREVLKEMPRGQTMAMGGPRAATRSSPSGGEAGSSEESKAKLKRMANSGMSNYGQQCAEITAVSTGKDVNRIGSLPFNGIIRNGFQPHLERWRENADEAKVRVLADACRGLHFFITDKGAPTQYKDDFIHHKATGGPTDFSSEMADKNVSCVPMGCIGATTSQERQATELRAQKFREMLATAKGREQDILSGAAFKTKIKMDLCSYPGIPEASADQCLKSGLAPTREWRSQGKATHNNDVHSRGAQLKFGSAHSIKRGETKLRLEGCVGDLRRPRLPLSQSSPALAK